MRNVLRNGGALAGPCAETAVGSGVFTRAYPRADVSWDCAAGRCVATVEGAHGGFVAALALDPTTRTLASAGDDRSLKLWECR